MALYRCIDRSVVLRHNTDDITSTLHAGERWRADVRSAGTGIRVKRRRPTDSSSLFGQGEVTYRFSENVLARRFGDGS